MLQKDNTIENIIELADQYSLVKKDDNLNKCIKENKYIYDRVKKVDYQEVPNWYSYINNNTPFSTQHGIKGEEFDNVLIVLGDSSWTKYNFQYLFNKTIEKQKLIDGKLKTKSKLDNFDSIYKKTLNIFYVCCTRAKENLVIFYSNPSVECIHTAKEWFGENNVYSLDKFLDVC